MSDKNNKRIWELMSEIHVAMVVTHSDDGEAMRARPMAPRPRVDDGAIYFLTDANTAKDDEIENNADVCIAFSDPKGNRYVSVTGKARVTRDAVLAARLWSSADKGFWPDANDPRIRVIEVDPQQGEFWEGPGMVMTVVKMLTSSITGSRPKLGESEKVVM